MYFVLFFPRRIVLALQEYCSLEKERERGLDQVAYNDAIQNITKFIFLIRIWRIRSGREHQSQEGGGGGGRRDGERRRRRCGWSVSWGSRDHPFPLLQLKNRFISTNKRTNLGFAIKLKYIICLFASRNTYLHCIILRPFNPSFLYYHHSFLLLSSFVPLPSTLPSFHAPITPSSDGIDLVRKKCIMQRVNISNSFFICIPPF